MKGQTELVGNVDHQVILWDNFISLKALMETSRPVCSVSEPGTVRAGAVSRAQNPSGAAN